MNATTIPRNVFCVTDGTGITAETAGQNLPAQCPDLRLH